MTSGGSMKFHGRFDFSIIHRCHLRVLLGFPSKLEALLSFGERNKKWKI